MPRRDQSLVDHSTEDMASERDQSQGTQKLLHTHTVYIICLIGRHIDTETVDIFFL